MTVSTQDPSINILDIILRFRVHYIAISADIEKAFLVVSMLEEDRDALRFLWIDDISKDIPRIATLRFTRVVFGVTASPFLLNATLNLHIDKYLDQDPEFVDKMKRSMYVDDVVAGAFEYNEAYRFYSLSKQQLLEGGFTLQSL